MLIYAQVNFGTNFSPIIGISYIVLGLTKVFFLIQQNRLRSWFLFIYLFELSLLAIIALTQSQNLSIIVWIIGFISLLILTSLIILIAAWVQNFSNPTFTNIFEVIFIPNLFLCAGLIVLFHGWRLDPILQAQALGILILVTYLFLKSNL
ncbi:hypothetical protein NIES3974_04810 [Calothrix sp. NIES-3974]|nr:hypothetical protein NIES3974_04810 [Calothrix sp. NIES-3974]